MADTDTTMEDLERLNDDIIGRTRLLNKEIMRSQVMKIAMNSNHQWNYMVSRAITFGFRIATGRGRERR
uniref:Uncharacterized protein n=1 Tax=Tetranychus urticae TaxID=32264 RepID=T1KAP6_TETUR